MFEPIGVVHSPLIERAQAPRQPGVRLGHEPAASSRVDGCIELFAGRAFEDALVGLDTWEYVWVLFVFHRNIEQERGWKPKVQPPRAEAKVGVFATRSPHRPNPIGMSAVKIVRVEGRRVHVRGIDLLDGTPVLDLKPYVPYADAHPGARSGWLQPADPLPAWEVTFSEAATEQLAWLRTRGVDLRSGVESALALGPQPHAYRRIRTHGDGMRLALKDWRVDFRVEERTIVVRAVASGYRPKELQTQSELETHRDFAARFA